MADTPISQTPVVVTLPGMDAVLVRRDVPYQLNRDVPMTLDIYSPAGTAASATLPAVVFVSGASDAGFAKAVGCRYKEMAWTTSWATLAAVSGIVGIAYSNSEPDDVHAVLRHVRHYGADLGVDGARIGIVASSGHAPMALSVLMKDRALRCAALLYGYMLDWPGSTLVADALEPWGFANPAAGRPITDMRTDIPIFVARAGLDHFPHLNVALDRFVLDALARNMPLTVMNHATGRHAFDLLDDSPATRDVVLGALSFLGTELGVARGTTYTSIVP